MQQDEHSERSAQTLSNERLVAKFGVDTNEKEPLKVWIYSSSTLGFRHLLSHLGLHPQHIPLRDAHLRSLGWLIHARLDERRSLQL